MRRHRSSWGELRTGWVIGTAVAASVGCSDGRTSPVVFEQDAGTVSNTVATADTTGGPVTETTDDERSMTSDSREASTGGEPGTEVSSVGASSFDGSTELSTVESAASVSTSDVTDPSDLNSSGTTDTSADDGAVAPPANMVVLANFNVEQGFNDGQGSLAAGVNRFYAQSLMSLEIQFTTGGGGSQQYGVNFNTTAVFCGYDLVARVRLVSGFNATASAPGGVQLRVWSDSWSQFASRWTAVSGSGQGNHLGQWLEYRFPWTVAATQNPALDVYQLNGVGIAFISGGSVTDAYTTAHFDVDWIGFVPSDDACPIDTGSTGGGETSGTGSGVDSGVLETNETDVAVGDAGLGASPGDAGDASLDVGG